MTISSKPKLVVLGMISKYPVAGVIWQTLHYLLGFERLGFETYYVEDHGMPPTKLMHATDLDGSIPAAQLIDKIMRRFGFDQRWAFRALHSDGACYGLSLAKLEELYQSAEVIFNLHGSTVPRPEHYATNRLVYLETDPVAVQIQIHDHRQDTLDYLEPHCAFYTFGENIGRPGCQLPVSSRFPFKATRQPILLELWTPLEGPQYDAAKSLTTIGNWRQTNMGKEISFQGEVYQWSKHLEFEKFINLPRVTRQSFELALSFSSCSPGERQSLLDRGWSVCDALSFSSDLDAYRTYIRESRGEFTVAKEQNIRLRTGWFSDRAATYLASGRPVITQETGFSDNFPMREGLFAFSTIEEVLIAIESINANYSRHRRAAVAITREYFGHDVVLKPILADLGALRSRSKRWSEALAECSNPSAGAGAERQSTLSSLPASLILAPISRLPLRLPPETMQIASALPVPWLTPTLDARIDGKVRASIVIVTHHGLPYTKMCLTALFATWNPHDELIIVDNASKDGTQAFLADLLAANNWIRLLLNTENRGFAAANNQGAALAKGAALILLNNDTLVTPGWSDRLLAWVEQSDVGLVGPLTNRTCNEAQIETDYCTYGEMLSFAEDFTGRKSNKAADIRMAAMFCVAMRREVFDKAGPLDEQFGIGMFEDEDYSLQVRAAGYRVICVEDVFIHHFSQASFGELCGTGELDRLLERNKALLERKWNFTWEPHDRRHSDEYLAIRERIRQIVASRLPSVATVTIISKGDEELLQLGGRVGWHFPQLPDGQYPAVYPAESGEAIEHLETLRSKGATFFLIPKTAFWWLDFYKEFRAHLEANYPLVLRDDRSCILYDLRGGLRFGRSQAAPEAMAVREPLLAQLNGDDCGASDIHSIKPAASIIIPVFNHQDLTRQCLETVFKTVPKNVEVLVVDDGSTDETQRILDTFGDRVRVLRHVENKGFAQSCNDGAAAAWSDHFIFLNNDTLPRQGWLTQLLQYAGLHPAAGIVGAKLLFPNNTIQHAGVAICQDLYPRHIYAGFPAEHPAVCRSRRFEIVTAACMLVRRAVFEEAKGFDTSYRNGFEDVDLCLRAGADGHEVHYCAESVLVHLESASPGRNKHDRQNAALYRRRWMPRVQPDDVRFYLADGLMRFDYECTFPFHLEVSSRLAVIADGAASSELVRQLEKQSRDIAALLRENARLSLALRKHAPGTPEVKYEVLRNDLREAVASCIPSGSTIAVVSKGDHSLLDFPGHKAWHFPSSDRGTYAGHHPADCTEAIQQLQRTRARGAGFLVIPATAAWWLDHYTGFRDYLNTHFHCLYDFPHQCYIYDLQRENPSPVISTDSFADAVTRRESVI